MSTDLTNEWSVYLRIELDEHGRSLPGEHVGAEAEAKISEARRLERAGLALIESYPTAHGREYVIKRRPQRNSGGLRS